MKLNEQKSATICHKKTITKNSKFEKSHVNMIQWNVSGVIYTLKNAIKKNE